MFTMLLVLLAMGPAEGPTLAPAVQAYLDARAAEADQIPPERRAELDRLADYVRSQRQTGAPVRLLFVCTHNSRRSHLAQVWAEVIGRRLGLDVASYSAGTEATAFNARAVAALGRAGLTVREQPAEATGGPRYTLTYGEGLHTAPLYSKRMPDGVPEGEGAPFGAVMVCGEADKACPVVPNASFRIALPYDDPKAADGTPEEAATYDARCAQIARELHYALSRAAR